MKKLYSLLKKYKYHVIVFFTARYDIREYIVQIGMALCIGAIAGLGAMVFHTLIEWMRIAINPKHFAHYLEIPSFIMGIIPVIGGVTRFIIRQVVLSPEQPMDASHVSTCAPCRIHTSIAASFQGIL